MSDEGHGPDDDVFLTPPNDDQASIAEGRRVTRSQSSSAGGRTPRLRHATLMSSSALGQRGSAGRVTAMGASNGSRSRSAPYPPQQATASPASFNAAQTRSQRSSASSNRVRGRSQRALPMLSPSPPPSRADGPPAEGARPARSPENLPPPAAAVPGSLYRLRLQALVKKTVNERDSSGDTLDEKTVYGTSFNSIMQRIWDDYHDQVFGIASKAQGKWMKKTAEFDDWPQVMVFKSKGHHIPRSRQESSWNAWLVRVRQDVEPVTLIIYKYGLTITTHARCKEFETKFLPPNPTDRAGATAEVAIVDVITQLRERWGSSLTASPVAWRLWASHITGANDNSRWEALISESPPQHLAGFFNATDSRVLQRNAEIRQTSRVALEIVQALISDYRVVRNDVDALARRLDDVERNLMTKQRVLEGFIEALVPPPPSAVDEVLERIQNIDDVEHQLH